MKDLQVKRAFNEIAEKFFKDNFDLNTISELISLIRLYRNELSPEEATILLDIPINVLENNVKLNDPNTWSSYQGSYFSGNITGVKTDYFEHIKRRLSSGIFELKDIIELTEVVRDNYDVLYSASEFLLRNIEVTIRDDVKLYDHTNFKKSGEIFAQHIKKAINL